MKSLGSLLFLVFITTSVAELGYNYQQPEELGVQQNVAYTPQPTYLPPQFNGGSGYQSQNYAPAQESYKKSFFIYSAPEEDFEDPYVAQKISSTLQKNVRVVFIRAPEQKGLEQAALQLAKNVYDDRTAIYVLNKQTDIGELANRLSAHREQVTHKPEVHFVKYRTPEDALNAQQQIQAQYDALRGTSHTSNEGSAPVLDFASKQQPSYGSAISIAPAYNTNGGSAGGYIGQQYLGNSGLVGAGGLGVGGGVGVGVGVGVGGINSFSSFNTASFNTQDYHSGVGVGGGIGGFETIGYNSNTANNAAYSAALSAYGETPRSTGAQQVNAENSAAITNGAKFAFPSDGATANTYIPPLKRRQRHVIFKEI